MICENKKCNKGHDGSFGSGRFCSRACANARVHSEETKRKIIPYLHKHRHKKVQKEKFCRDCKTSIGLTDRKVCDKCRHKQKVQIGKKLGENRRDNPTNRSKNEIYFSELCKAKFKDVETNVPMFNGRDADVIIHDLKVAVMWDGEWHWRQTGCRTHSLKQIQARDKYRIKQIIKCGYKPVTIIDPSRFNPSFVERMFEEFLKEVIKSV